MISLECTSWHLLSVHSSQGVGLQSEYDSESSGSLVRYDYKLFFHPVLSALHDILRQLEMNHLSSKRKTKKNSESLVGTIKTKRRLTNTILVRSNYFST